jgi:hypothetical protein
MRMHTLKDPNVIKAINALPAIGSTDGDKEDRPAVKIFHSPGNAFWIIWESDPNGMLFGYAEMMAGCGELGYSNLNSLVDELGIWGERDIHVNTLVEAYNSRDVPIPDYLVKT